MPVREENAKTFSSLRGCGGTRQVFVLVLLYLRRERHVVVVCTAQKRPDLVAVRARHVSETYSHVYSGYTAHTLTRGSNLLRRRPQGLALHHRWAGFGLAPGGQRPERGERRNGDALCRRSLGFVGGVEPRG